MPASTRSRVVLPEPLWPTRPTRSPSLISRLMPSMARTVMTSRAPDITRPPVACDNILFLSERWRRKSRIRPSGFRWKYAPSNSDPVCDAGVGPAIKPRGEAEPGRRHADAETPAHWRHHLTKQRRPDDLDEVIEWVEHHKGRPVRQGFGRPEDRGQEKKTWITLAIT